MADKSSLVDNLVVMVYIAPQLEGCCIIRPDPLKDNCSYKETIYFKPFWEIDNAVSKPHFIKEILPTLATPQINTLKMNSFDLTHTQA
jgi:hypothetical protein